MSGHGDVEVGFKEADLIVEDSFKTEATHQGYIEPHACLATLGNDGKGELWWKLFEIELKRAFKADPVDTTLVGWTPLGHYEMQRKRERVSLESVLKS